MEFTIRGLWLSQQWRIKYKAKGEVTLNGHYEHVLKGHVPSKNKIVHPSPKQRTLRQPCDSFRVLTIRAGITKTHS